MLLLKLSFRSLFRQRRRTILTMLSMIVGYLLLSLSVGLADGSYNAIIELFTSLNTGHIQIHARGYLERPGIYKTIDNTEGLLNLLKEIPEILSFTERIHGNALIFGNDTSVGASVIGINTENEKKTTKIEKSLKAGRFLKSNDFSSVIIDEKLSRVLKVDIGSELILISQGADGSISNDVFNIIGIISSHDSSSFKCLMNIKAAQNFFSLENRFHEIVLRLPSQKMANAFTKKLNERLNSDKIEIHSWEEIEPEFYRAMKVDKAGNYVQMFIIGLIVGLTVMSAVLMNLLERTREYGVMLALGTRNLLLLSIILSEILLMSLISVSIGILISTPLNYLLSLKGIPIPEVSWGGMKFSEMYSELSFTSIIIPAVVVVLIAFLVSFFPSLRIIKINIVRALRSF